MSTKAIRNLVILAGILLLAYLAFSPGGWLRADKKTAPPPAEESSESNQSSGLPVRGHLIKISTLVNSLSVTGTLYPDEEVEITCEASGIIEKIHFREGRRVAKGTMLMKVNDDELQARLKQVEYKIQLAQQLEARKKKLLEIGGISQEEYDQSLTEYNTLNTDAELIKVQIGKTEIRAPFSGVIGLRKVSQGSYITPGTRVATILKTDRIKVEFSVPEKYANKIANNTPISFSIEGLNNEFEGKVYAREPSINMETRTLLLKGISTNPNGVLIPGAFANVKIELGKFEDAILIPTHALLPEQGGHKVFIARNGEASSQVVSTGIRQSDQIQILSGIQEGDTVITSGLLQIQPGLQIAITELE